MNEHIIYEPFSVLSEQEKEEQEIKEQMEQMNKEIINLIEEEEQESIMLKKKYKLYKTNLGGF